MLTQLHQFQRCWSLRTTSPVGLCQTEHRWLEHPVPRIAAPAPNSQGKGRVWVREDSVGRFHQIYMCYQTRLRPTPVFTRPITYLAIVSPQLGRAKTSLLTGPTVSRMTSGEGIA